VNGLFAVQSLLMLVLSIAALGLEAWALFEAVRFRKDAYPAAGKQTKVLWVAILAVATALGVIHLGGNPLGFLSILSVAAAGGFLAGVRPALRAVQGRGGSTSSGPYGGW